MSHECKNTKIKKKTKENRKKENRNEDHMTICLFTYFLYESRSYEETSHLDIISKYRLNPQNVTTVMKKTMLPKDRLEI